MAARSKLSRYAEWLSLIETSGPFLSITVLKDAFPQGIQQVSSDTRRLLHQAFEEWEDDQLSAHPDGAIHAQWIRFVLREGLDYSPEVLRDTDSIPATLRVELTDHGEVIGPDLFLVDPDGDPKAGQPSLLINTYPRRQSVTKPVANRRWVASPVERMAELLQRTGNKLGLVTNGEQWTLVSRCADTLGTAAWQASLWSEERTTQDSFTTLLGAHRFFATKENETLEALLTRSADDQTEVTNQLGAQVRRAVEMIVETIDRIDKDRGRTLLAGVDEKTVYEAALTVMMRLEPVLHF